MSDKALAGSACGCPDACPCQLSLWLLYLTFKGHIAFYTVILSLWKFVVELSFPSRMSRHFHGSKLFPSS